MQRRAFERIPSNIKVSFSCCGMDYNGTVTDISEKGMLIKTKEIYFPFDSEFELSMLSSKEVMRLSVKLNRVVMSPRSYDCIGVAILSPPQSYLSLVKNLRQQL